ncbi:MULTISPECIES: hypothetical protein [Photobacterium]|uniref:hypothetical protein n=1 Tax=Photobacterium TaxID=657 RepID=UPI0011B231E2|nr:MULTISPECIES: hypothetical protein [Photobacterium]QSV14974.1 hypothetical protein FH974_05080 [Photobacterium ganghwense]
MLGKHAGKWAETRPSEPAKHPFLAGVLRVLTNVRMFDPGQSNSACVKNEQAFLMLIKANCALNPLSDLNNVSNISNDYISCSLTTN